MTKRERSAERARYIMIGGFLGAGKTTAMARLARRFTDQGKRVGLISNDQSRGLVDTALLRSKGFPVEEIPGGCFCCRFNSLVEAADKLDRSTRPEIFLAEPVGSCTDLVATVSYPLRRIYGNRFEVAPMSVMVDPSRAARILGLEKGPEFSEKVVYVYRKQLEEADIIVVNKCDSVSDPSRGRLVAALEGSFARAKVVCCSAKEGSGLEAWFNLIDKSQPGTDPSLELDYDLYAEGEALLGWVNCTVRLTSAASFDANQTLLGLAGELRSRIVAGGGGIAHLKMTIESGDGSLSVVSLVRNDGEPDLRESLLDRVSGGSLIINLRAEADPDFLEQCTRRSLESLGGGIGWTIEHSEHFRPARPTPVHRMSGPEEGTAT
jgi:G3E family GTPase